MINTLYTNDNLFILHGLNSELVDLIYLDPPFNSNKNYFAPIGSKVAGSSFKDVWTWQDVNEDHLDKLVEDHPSLIKFIQSIQVTHSKGMMAYITYMAQRIIEMHRVLKPTGSFYLHCDPTASHYLKVVLDEIFGRTNFLNEVVWFYQGTANPKKHFKRKHDIILFYAKNSGIHFFNDKGSSEEISDFSKTKFTKEDDLGKYKEIKHKNGTIHKQYLREEQRCRDVWAIPIINAMSKERTNYPTQKPLALLERIVKASSKEGDLVLDPFCGCATTCVAAQKLNRKWIGIDIEEQSVKVLIDRLEKGGFVDDSLKFVKKEEDFIHTTNIPQRTDIIIEQITNTSVKERLFNRQSGHCNACRVEMRIFDFKVDHIIPKSKGGGDYFENYQLLCGSCNKIKSDRPMEYLRTKIKKREEMLIKNQFTFGE